MEFLKKIAALCMLLLSFNAFSQSDDVMLSAFEESYNYEKSYNYDKAIESIVKVYKESTYETNLRLGWLYYCNKNYAQSATYYKKAISIMPYSIEAKFGLVNAAAATGSYDICVQQYKDILVIDSQNSKARYYLALYYYNKANYSEAAKYLESTANQYPFDYDITILYAWINLKISKMREAKILFNNALLMRPNDASAKEGLSMLK